jgi:hypothetical protein
MKRYPSNDYQLSVFYLDALYVRAVMLLALVLVMFVSG